MLKQNGSTNFYFKEEIFKAYLRNVLSL